MNDRLLVFNCHEAWIYQLQSLHCPLDIIVNLRGRQVAGWDENMRPFPKGARFVEWGDVLRGRESYRCIVTHNLTDLLDARALSGPRILMLHETIEGAAREQSLAVPVSEFRDAVARFAQLTETYVVAVSKLKAESWGVANEVITSGVDPAAYLPWRGDLSNGLRVANHIARRPHTLLWKFHEVAFRGLPVTIVGRNPEWEGVEPARNWADLKETFSQHRFYIHTADPKLEDGFNMAMLEAMAAGLPVLGNRHPTSPIEHGVSGFLSDDPTELHAYAQRLLADRELAGKMGAAAQGAVSERFSGLLFQEKLGLAIERARKLWSMRNHPSTVAAKATSVR
jgi:glycosyltransferase involved in cell wall biosynthesis